MDTWQQTRDREQKRKNSWRGSREDCDERVESGVPESKGSTMCLTPFKSQLWVETILTIEMMAIGG